MQVGCTINYGRKVLWKKWEKLRTISFWQKCGNSRPRLFVERSSTPLHSQLGTLFRDRLALTIWVRSARILKAVRNGQSVVSPNSGPVAQLGARFHGMEEVVGSIPTRSTKSLNNLDRETPRRHGVCVLVLVMTRRLGAHGKGFHRRPLRFHPHMALQTLQRFDKSNARNWILRLPRATFRFHDLRHCAITQLAENCTSDSTIMAIAGHVSRSMLIARDTNCPMANIKRIS